MSEQENTKEANITPNQPESWQNQPTIHPQTSQTSPPLTVVQSESTEKIDEKLDDKEKKQEDSEVKITKQKLSPKYWVEETEEFNVKNTEVIGMLSRDNPWNPITYMSDFQNRAWRAYKLYRRQQGGFVWYLIKRAWDNKFKIVSKIEAENISWLRKQLSGYNTIWDFAFDFFWKMKIELWKFQWEYINKFWILLEISESNKKRYKAIISKSNKKKVQGKNILVDDKILFKWQIDKISYKVEVMKGTNEKKVKQELKWELFENYTDEKWKVFPIYKCENGAFKYQNIVAANIDELKKKLKWEKGKKWILFQLSMFYWIFFSLVNLNLVYAVKSITQSWEFLEDYTTQNNQVVKIFKSKNWMFKWKRFITQELDDLKQKLDDEKLKELPKSIIIVNIILLPFLVAWIYFWVNAVINSFIGNGETKVEYIDAFTGSLAWDWEYIFFMNKTEWDDWVITQKLTASWTALMKWEWYSLPILNQATWEFTIPEKLTLMWNSDFSVFFWDDIVLWKYGGKVTWTWILSIEWTVEWEGLVSISWDVIYNKNYKKKTIFWTWMQIRNTEITYSLDVIKKVPKTLTGWFSKTDLEGKIKWLAEITFTWVLWWVWEMNLVWRIDDALTQADMLKKINELSKHEDGTVEDPTKTMQKKLKPFMNKKIKNFVMKNPAVAWNIVNMMMKQYIGNTPPEDIKDVSINLEWSGSEIKFTLEWWPWEDFIIDLEDPEALAKLKNTDVLQMINDLNIDVDKLEADWVFSWTGKLTGSWNSLIDLLGGSWAVWWLSNKQLEAMMAQSKKWNLKMEDIQKMMSSSTWATKDQLWSILSLHQDWGSSVDLQWMLDQSNLTSSVGVFNGTVKMKKEDIKAMIKKENEVKVKEIKKVTTKINRKSKSIENVNNKEEVKTTLNELKDTQNSTKELVENIEKIKVKEEIKKELISYSKELDKTIEWIYKKDVSLKVKNNNLSASLWVEVSWDRFDPIISRWKKLPTSGSQEYYTSEEWQTYMTISILEWTSSKASKNKRSWEVNIHFKAMDKIWKRVKVTFNIDKEWKIKVEAVDLLNSRNKVNLDLEASVDNIMEDKWFDAEAVNNDIKKINELNKKIDGLVKQIDQ